MNLHQNVMISDEDMHSLPWQEEKIGVLYIVIHSHELNALGRQFFISIR